jgi:hypothetical protein
MKRVFTILGLTMVIFTANAQDKKEKGGTQGSSISIGAEVGVPSGDLADGWKLGLGGSAKAAFNVTNNGFITVSAGYISFSGKDAGFGIKMPAMNLIPLKAGFRYNFGGFYVEPQVGYTIAKAKGGDSDGGFTWAPNVGYMINNMIDLSARYESVSLDGSSLSHLGFRVAYNFSLGGR